MSVSDIYERARSRINSSRQDEAALSTDPAERNRQLEELAEKSGASAPILGFKRSAKNAARAVIDVLSRPNYAIAGAFEEVFSGGSASDVLHRASSELLSGIGEIKGEKHQFGEVFENLGFGEGPSLSDVFPFIFSDTGEGPAFKRGGGLDFTTRGTVGLAADIFTDPTIIATFGVSKAAPIVGGRFLSAAGIARRSKIAEEIMSGIKSKRLPAGRESKEIVKALSNYREISSRLGRELDLGEMRNIVSEATGQMSRSDMLEQFRKSSLGEQGRVARSGLASASQRNLDTILNMAGVSSTSVGQLAQILAQDQAMRRVVASIDSGAIGFLDMGGIKMWGRSVPGTAMISTLLSGLHPQFVRVLGALDSATGVRTLEGARFVRERVIDPFGRMLNVAWDARHVTRYMRMRSEFLNGMARDKQQWKHTLESSDALMAVSKMGSTKQKKIVDLYESDGIQAVVKAYGAGSTEHEAMSFLAKRMRLIIESERRLGYRVSRRTNYFSHYYENQGLSVEHALNMKRGRNRVTTANEIDRHMEDVVYDTLAEAVDDTTAKNAAWLAGLGERVDVLRPVYNPIEVLFRRGSRSIEATHWNAFLRKVNARWGSESMWSSPERIWMMNRQMYSDSVSPAEMERIAALTTKKLSFSSNPDNVPVSGSRIEGKPSPVVIETEKTIHDTLRTEHKRYLSYIKRGMGSGAVISRRKQAELIRHGASLTGPTSSRSITLPTVIQPGERMVIDVGNDLSVVTTVNKDFLSSFKGHSLGGPVTDLERVYGHKPYSSYVVSRKSRRIVRAAEPVETPDAVVRWARATVAPAEGRKAAIDAANELEKVSAVRGMSEDGRFAFFDARFRAIRSREEFSSVVTKYEEFDRYFPRQHRLADEISPLGERMSPVAVKGLGTVDVPESIARDIEQIKQSIFDSSKEYGLLLRGWDAFQNSFKAAVTVLWPAFHVRNAMSNVSQTFVDIGVGALDPKWHVNAARVLSGSESSFVLGGNSYTGKQLKEFFSSTGIITSGRSILEYTGKNAGGLSEYGSSIKNVLSAPVKHGSALGGVIENEARVQYALNLLRRGLNLEETATRVQKFLFDYSFGITRTEREWFRRIFPFYLWQSKNLRLQLENILKRPGKLAAQVKAFRGREDENEAMTTWEGDALKLRLNRDGNTVSMVTGIDLPIRNLDIIWRGTGADTLRSLYGMMSPGVKVLGELAFGVEAFTGREFTRQVSSNPVIGETIARMPKSIKTWFGFKKTTDAAGRATYSYDKERYYLLFQSWVTSRFVSTTDRAFRDYINGSGTGHASFWLDFLTSLRHKNVDLTAEQERSLREKNRILEGALLRAGELRKLQITYAPRGEQ